MLISEKHVSELPTTRHSLLQRVRNPHDADAWREFLRIYQPTVYRYARRKGLQPVDAEDLAQRVFTAASQKVKVWNCKNQQGSFRAWILLVTRNAVINATTRRVGDRSFADLECGLDAAEEDQRDVELDREYRRALFRRAAELVRNEFSSQTWQAFWRTAVDGEDLKVVSQALGISIGTLYAARSRVMRRLQETVQQIEKEEER